MTATKTEVLGRLVFIRPVSLSDEYEANACFMSCPY
jgi:hypothetical protein